MTGLLYALAPALVAGFIARTERAHRPVALALGASALYSLASLAPLPSELRLILWALVALASARAYARAFGWVWIDGPPLLALACVAALVARFTWQASIWQIATWGPFVASSTVGALSLWRWRIGRPITWGRESRGWRAKARATIVQHCAAALLASDVATLAFIPWPGVQAWQGRAAAVAVTVMQVIWLMRKG